jgi:hypothetical protein
MVESQTVSDEKLLPEDGEVLEEPHNLILSVHFHICIYILVDFVDDHPVFLDQF